MPSVKAFIVLLVGAQLAACASTPAYVAPTPPVGAHWQTLGPWTPAAPADAQPRGDWWALFGDPVLDDLQARAARANPNLAVAIAAHDRAGALAAQARADLYPELDAAALKQRTRRSVSAPFRVGGANQATSSEIGATLSYEADLWGQVRARVAAQGAGAQASAADLLSVRLSLQADLADTYLALRGLDAQVRLLDDTVAAYDRALSLTRALHVGGAAPSVDVQRAVVQHATATTQRSEAVIQRALLVHAIAALVGESASTFVLPPTGAEVVLPTIPVTAPAVLLQRRPDIAAAERRAFAANAQIGAARAALFPALTLDATGGWQSSGGERLLTAPNLFWLLGPQLAGVIFDSGRRRAGVRIARADLEASGAAYRAVVLDAFRDVEDQLVLADHLATQARDQATALAAARRSQDLATIRYREGAAAYTEVIVAQAAALDAARATIVLRTRRAQAAVDLVRALGGAWG